MTDTGGGLNREVKKFNDLASEWWDPKGRNKGLHLITPPRFDYFSGAVAEAGVGGAEGMKSLKVLDVGCGGGILSERIAEAGAQVTGIDLAPGSIDIAKSHSESRGLDIDYRNVSIEDLAGEMPESFDCVVCSEVLEHVDDIEPFVKASIRALRLGGIYCFSTINKTLKARMLAIYVAEDILGMLDHGTHDYDKLVRPSSLVNILRDSNVEVKELKGLTFDILSYAFRTSKDTSINYMGYGVKGPA